MEGLGLKTLYHADLEKSARDQLTIILEDFPVPWDIVDCNGIFDDLSDSTTVGEGNLLYHLLQPEQNFFFPKLDNARSHSVELRQSYFIWAWDAAKTDQIPVCIAILVTTDLANWCDEQNIKFQLTTSKKHLWFQNWLNFINWYNKMQQIVMSYPTASPKMWQTFSSHGWASLIPVIPKLVFAMHSADTLHSMGGQEEIIGIFLLCGNSGLISELGEGSYHYISILTAKSSRGDLGWGMLWGSGKADTCSLGNEKVSPGFGLFQ